jgi:hypothetical protein
MNRLVAQLERRLLLLWLVRYGATQKIKIRANTIGRIGRNRSRESAIACLPAMPRDQLALRASSSNIRLLKSPPFFLLHTQTTLYFTIPQDALRPSSPPLDLPSYLPTFLPSYLPTYLSLPLSREFPLSSTSSYTPRHPILQPHHPLPLHPLLPQNYSDLRSARDRPPNW